MVPEHGGKRLKYMQGLLWDGENDTVSSTACWSLRTDPVPTILKEEYLNLPAMNTLATYLHLSHVICQLMSTVSMACWPPTQTNH